MSDTTPKITDRRFDRRQIVKGVAGATAAAGFTGAGLKASRTFAAPNLQTGLSGTIRVAYADELGAKPPYVEAAAQAVMDANPDATVEIDLRQIAGGDFLTQLALELDSGDGPDVIHIGGDRIGQFAESGYIEPLDSYLTDWEDWEAQYPESVRGGVTYNDQVWAIPYGLDVRWLYFRRDVMEQVGLGRDWEPANFAGILEAATAIKEAGLEGVLPYALYAGTGGSGGTTSHGYAPALFANGGQLLTPEGQWVASSAAHVAAYQHYVDAWREAEVVPTDILTTPEPWKPMREGMGTGRVALLFEGGWVYGGYQAAAAEGNVNLDDIGYVLYPTTEAGPSFTIGGPGTCWYIGAGSENKDLAWEFIKAFNNPQTVADLNIEDPHPVARMDAAQTEAFQEEPYLVACTDALDNAFFLPPLELLNDVSLIVQEITGQVATGDLDAEAAAERYAEELVALVGEENTVTL